MAQEHKVNDGAATGTRHDVSKIVSQPKYKADTFDFDFAILELTDALDLTGDSKARAACLPSATDSQFVPGTKFVISGWGALSQGGSSPNVLHSAVVPHISDAVCNSNYGGRITSQMVCAGHAKGGIDSCQGDSGGKANPQS